MKEWICKHYPELSKIRKSPDIYDQLARAIEEAWNALDQEYGQIDQRYVGESVETLFYDLLKAGTSSIRIQMSNYEIAQLQDQLFLDILQRVSRNPNEFWCCSNNFRGGGKNLEGAPPKKLVDTFA